MAPVPSQVVVTQTKIRLPFTASAVARPRLDDHARRIVDYAATIVAAGAGFGKTTVLHAWARRCAEYADVVWLGLDDGDARVRSLATYLDAALRRALPKLGPSVAELLREGRSEPAVLARAIVNELYDATEESERDVVVFLDDFHTVGSEPEIRLFVGELLRMLPPRAHLTIATRFPLEFSPLIKLRAERRIADFDGNDLRFRDDEIVALLAESGIALADNVSLRALSRRTDGWAMALRLSMQAPGEIGGGEHPFGATTERSLFAYMAEEVLREQPPEVRDTLLVCSIPKHLDAATVGRAIDGDGARVLETLLARNLYLEPAGERTYRFHNLFREFLLQAFEREDPARVRDVRLRYASLLEERGDMVAAASQYIQAGDYAAAIPHVHAAMRAVKWGDDFERIARVLDSIPPDVMRERPEVLRMQALAKRRSLDFKGAIEGLERVVAYAAENGDAILECLAVNDLVLLYGDMRLGGYGNYERNIALAQRALAKLPPGPQAERAAQSTRMMIAIAHASMYDFAKAHEYLDEAFKRQLESPTGHTDILNTVSHYYGAQGNWPKALEIAELSEALVRESGPVFLGRALRLQAKARCYLREDLPRALALAEEALEFERAQNKFDNLPEAYITLARTMAAQAVPDVGGAHAALDEAERRLKRWQNRVVQFELHVMRLQVHLIDGDEAAAKRQLAAAQAIAERYDDPHHRAMATFAEALLHTKLGEAGALDRFETARDRFVPTKDLFHATLAALAAAGLRARQGTLDVAGLRALLDRLEADNQTYVVRSAPRSAADALVWALRHGVETKRAQTLLESGAHAGDGDQFAALAAAAGVSPEARVAAVGILAREGSGRRELLVRLARDPSPPVAAAAATALRLLPAPATAPLSLRIVGRARIEIGAERLDERDARWGGRRKAVEMLRALALAEGPISKAALLAALWPESSAAAAETNLRVTLHALRRALQPEVDGPGDYVEYDGAFLSLRPEAVAFVDAREASITFRRAALARSRGETDEARALCLATVDLLPAIPEEADVPAWLAPHVRAWREMFAASLRALAEIERARGTLAAARGFIERALAVEPLDETSVAEAIEIAIAAGDLDRARAVFLTYKERLSSELDARPSPLLLERYGRVLEARASARSSALTERDVQVLRLVSRGRSSKQIAAELDLSVFAVNAQIARIMRKLQVDSRAAAVAAASGLLDS